eukprot:c22511_g2_i1 orf=269-940(-)
MAYHDSRVLMLIILMIHLPLLFCCCSTSLKFEDDYFGLALQSKARHLAGSSLLCGVVNCMKGTCLDSTSLPFYQCQCDEGWQSPLNVSWIPCVLPNCSINLGCDSSTNATAPPAPDPTNASFNICSLSICGDGECIPSGNATLAYECKCNPGSTNLLNMSNGYCLQPCSIGADCSNLNISLGAPPPPPPGTTSQNSSQGTKQALVGNLIIVSGILMSLIGWCF